MTRAVVVERFGGPEHLRLTEKPEPHAGPGQIRVHVTAAGLNPVDLRIAEGGPSAQKFGVVPPFVNGNDFAGVIDEVGDGVTGWMPGQRVYGGARCAAQTDHLIVDDPTILNRTPDNLADEAAGSLDIAGRTALAGIRALRLDDSDIVLVSAAAGGVGVFACQLARQTGATVIGTASTGNHEFLRSLGVIPISYGDGIDERIAEVAPSGLTAVFDANGVETIELGLTLGVPPERINSVADRAAAERLGALSVGRGTTPTSAVAEIAAAIATGALRMYLDEIFPLERARDAYERLASGHVRGKLALSLEPDARQAGGRS
ncbi:MAG TPA: NADP-dependent oxidoreductase [Galbitalea sp.]|jgi:NADPH:quinone reductase-like Zn-dependent oxidoreductase|nr:NADP-dependent oxidoreductase [Galbitalea sp.]